MGIDAVVALCCLELWRGVVLNGLRFKYQTEIWQGSGKEVFSS
jgi:hypothetical protein